MKTINEYHKQAIEKKKKSVADWQKRPLSLKECLNQFKRLREQRLARESKFMPSSNMP